MTLVPGLSTETAGTRTSVSGCSREAFQVSVIVNVKVSVKKSGFVVGFVRRVVVVIGGLCLLVGLVGLGERSVL